MRTHTHTHTHTYICAHIHTHTYIYVHTHTHTFLVPKSSHSYPKYIIEKKKSVSTDNFQNLNICPAFFALLLDT